MTRNILLAYRNGPPTSLNRVGSEGIFPSLSSHTTVCTYVYGGFFKVFYNLHRQVAFLFACRKPFGMEPARFGNTVRVRPPQTGGCLALVLPSDSSGTASLDYPFAFSNS